MITKFADLILRLRQLSQARCVLVRFFKSTRDAALALCVGCARGLSLPEPSGSESLSPEPLPCGASALDFRFRLPVVTVVVMGTGEAALEVLDGSGSALVRGVPYIIICGA